MKDLLQQLNRRYLRWRYKIPVWPPGRSVTYIGQPATILSYRRLSIQLRIDSTGTLIDVAPDYHINWLPLSCFHCGQSPLQRPGAGDIR